jgi:hypothetical protein
MLQEICAEIHVGDLRHLSPFRALIVRYSGSLFPQFTPQQMRDGLNSAFAELKPATGVCNCIQRKAIHLAPTGR